MRNFANRIVLWATPEEGQTMAEYGVVVALTALSGGISGAVNSVVTKL